MLSLWTAVICVVVLGLVYWQYWRWAHKRMLELAAKVPGPPALPILGNALIFMVNPGEILNKIATLHEEYGQYLKFWLGPDLNICVKNPADIRTLLTSNKVNHKGPVYDLMKPIIGPGILTGGPTWRNHRKIANPSYNKKSVEHFTNTFNLEAEQLAKVLANKDPTVKFDIYKDVVKFTTLSVNQTLMGLSKEESQNVYRMGELVENTRVLYDLIFAKMTRWWLQIPFIYYILGWKTKEDYFVKLIDDVAGDLVRKRRKALETSIPDEESLGIVDRYILSGELTEQEIKWDTITLFTTSQEAAAKVASGVLMFLSHLPDWQDLVYNEIIEVLGGHEPVSSEQVKQLQYLDMVYKETLRCLSIAALIQRTVEQEITINEGKFTLPEGTSLVIPIHHLHRDPQYWEDPWTVKPERFLAENVKKRDPNAFVPFSLGPMDCLGLSINAGVRGKIWGNGSRNTRLHALQFGRVYATALVKTIVVWVLRSVRIKPAGPIHDLNNLHVGISVSIAGGYNVRVEPRRNKTRANGVS